jgi:hypothetical protein
MQLSSNLEPSNIKLIPLILVWYAIKFAPPGFLSIFIFADILTKILANFYFLTTSYKPNSNSKILLGILLLCIAILVANIVELIFVNVCGFPSALALWLGAHVAFLLLIFMKKCRKPAKRKAINRKSCFGEVQS